MMLSETRRKFLAKTLRLAGYLSLGPSLVSLSNVASASVIANSHRYGPLRGPDRNGIRLPSGFSSRVIAVSREKVAGTEYLWHRSPDGGACFPKDDGGWVYASNSEEIFLTGGGASAVEFNAMGDIIAARRILGGTSINCAGGATPWHSWLSCEERDLGSVWETDPYGKKRANKVSALGAFKHEAVAVDPAYEHIYMTEDESDGCLYRFVPAKSFPDITEGDLQVALVDEQGLVSWETVPDPIPNFFGTRTRRQVAGAAKFNGGEGIWYHQGYVFFTTKGDNRVWILDTQSQTLEILYDKSNSATPVLSGVDNVTVSTQGDVLVAEDGGDMQIVLLNADGKATPFLQIVGQNGSEIAGPAFSPDGTRLYFSSQRGKSVAQRHGITYEIIGPF